LSAKFCTVNDELRVAYKVLTAGQWAALQTGQFRGAPVDVADGFIHLSTARQLHETVDRHFAGQNDLVIAAVDLSRLGDLVRWEPSRHDQLFPHLYCPLAIGMVLDHRPLERDENGDILLPS
jgi:uncharacterized protein (DUF952 family)